MSLGFLLLLLKLVNVIVLFFVFVSGLFCWKYHVFQRLVMYMLNRTLNKSPLKTYLGNILLLDHKYANSFFNII